MDIQQEIARIAYEIFIEHGSVPGHDIEHWLAAEEIALSRLESDREREEHVGKNPDVHAMHVIDPTRDTVVG